MRSGTGIKLDNTFTTNTGGNECLMESAQPFASKQCSLKRDEVRVNLIHELIEATKSVTRERSRLTWTLPICIKIN